MTSTKATTTFRNWAHIHSCQPANFYKPSSVDEISSIVANAAESKRTIKVSGCGHSPNDMAMTDDIMISTLNLNNILNFDPQTLQVTVQAGVQILELNAYLAERRAALRCLGSIGDMTIGGALAAGYHGSGIDHRMLASDVLSLSVVDGLGYLINASRNENPHIYFANLCGLGCVGVVVSVTIQCVPAFDLQHTTLPTKLSTVLSDLPAALTSADHMRFWWYPSLDHALLTTQQRVPSASPSLSSSSSDLSRQTATFEPVKSDSTQPQPQQQQQHDCVRDNEGLPRFPVMPAKSTSGVEDFTRPSPPSTLWGRLMQWVQTRLIGYHLLELLLFLCTFVWPKLPVLPRLLGNNFALDLAARLYAHVFNNRVVRYVDRSDKVFIFDCLFRQYVNEWSIPWSHTPEVLRRIQTLVEKAEYPVHFPIEVRFTQADDAWLSPAYNRDACYIGLIMYKPYGFKVEYERYFAAVEKIFLEFGGRPHWAKAFNVSGRALGKLYPRWDDFVTTRRSVDPRNVFVNPWVKKVLGEDV